MKTKELLEGIKRFLADKEVAGDFGLFFALNIDGETGCLFGGRDDITVFTLVALMRENKRAAAIIRAAAKAFDDSGRMLS